jgi:phosphotransacetylase
MGLMGFDELFAASDARRPALPLVVAGGADPTVIEALRIATDRGWVRATLTGSASEIQRAAHDREVSLDGIRIHETGNPAETAVAEVRRGEARLLMKGRIDTPSLMHAVLDPAGGLRADRAIGQIVLIELPRDARRFLLCDTGVMIRPMLAAKIELLRSAVCVARALGQPAPRVAAVAASESIKPEMPGTLDAAELQRLGETGAFGSCVVQGPLSFDLAYAADAGQAKRVAGPVIGAADVFLFPDLTSANLTVKAIMYTADCNFGGMLCGTTHPVVFMSRADSTITRLRSIALALALTASGDTTEPSSLHPE